MRWTGDPVGDEQPIAGESGVIDGPLDGDDGDDSRFEQRQEPPDETAVVVYAPSEQVDGALKPDTRVQLRYLEDGQLALPLFSSLDELVADCGEGQPWVAIAAERVEEFRQIVGADVAVLDPSIPTES